MADFIGGSPKASHQYEQVTFVAFMVLKISPLHTSICEYLT